MSEKIPLKNVSKVIGSGITPLRSNHLYWENGTIFWLKTEQLGERFIYETSEKITQLAIKQTSIKIFPKNTLSIAMYGEGRTRGNVSILKSEMTTNQACCNIVVDETKVYYEYVYYFLKTQYENLRNLSSGVRKNLNSNDIKEFEIILPENLSTQKQIAKVLSDLDAKIELNNKINTELEAMAKTLYDYWFVQFDFPDANGKPYKSSGGKMVWNEALKREIPEGWEVKELGEIANFTTGKLDSNAEVQNGKYPFFTCASEPTLTDTFAFDDNVILIAGNNASGNFHINRFKGKFNAYQRTYIVTSENPVDLEYIYQVLKTETKLLKSQGKGSQTKFLTIGMLTGIKVYRNNIKIIDNYNKIASSIYEKQVIIKEQNQSLSSLRDWLLPMLMNGQVSVVSTSLSANGGYVENEGGLGMVAEGKEIYRSSK
ncbi:restriction endonuclease subunit S [Flavobacterium oreochromis]|uniref:restriction endonuclease subunit S n=1 Tax=Flavobacterium oreochromis TaxID=2906078 RepID=UPI00385F2904